MPPCRPVSTSPGRRKNGRPMSPNSPLLKFGPTWQTVHCPVPTNMRSPRCAESGYWAAARASPLASASRNWSNGVAPETRVAVKAPIALAALTSVAGESFAGFSPNSCCQRQASAGSAAMARAICPGLEAISRGSVSARMDCDQMLSAAPSQVCHLAWLAFQTVGGPLRPAPRPWAGRR